MDTLNSVLILGNGPAAIQSIVNIKTKFNVTVGIAGRKSILSKCFFDELKSCKNQVEVKVQNDNHINMSGKATIDYVFEEYEDAKGKWDAAVITVTNDSCLSVLKRLSKEVVKNIKTFVIISSCIGLTSIVKGFLKKLDFNAEIITFSTYHADTKRDKSLNSYTCVLTKNVKKAIYICSTKEDSNVLHILKNLFSYLGIEINVVRNYFECEARSISTYVHPSILMNDFALSHIFNLDLPKTYIYKFFPEGPITQFVIHDMLQQVKEMRNILRKLGVEDFNFLKFINDDNYPVKSECLTRDDIENFEKFAEIKKEYLMYIRYASILVDAYSVPNKEGRYFDFSAVPMMKIYKNNEGYWCIPRSPKEDYFRLKLLKDISAYFGNKAPTINKLMKNYEKKVKGFETKTNNDFLSNDFKINNSKEEIGYIISTL